MPRIVLAVLVPLAALLSAVACDTDAKGIDDCRDMENARCVAAQSCDYGVDSEAKLEVCRRFARDNCLHGLSTGVEPKRGEVDGCLRVIQGAGECARKTGGDTSSIDCADIGETQREVTVCEVVEDPTLAFKCAWLLEDPPEPPDPDPDAGS